MSEVLDKLGIKPEEDEHPADTATLDRLGLKPESDEHPAERPMIGNRLLEPWEVTPGAPRLYVAPRRSTLQQVHEAIDPSTVIPAYLSRARTATGEYAGASARQIQQGWRDLMENRPASAVGNVGLGVGGLVTSLVSGALKPIEEELGNVTGNPEFASRSMMFMPMKVGSPAANTVRTNLAPTTRALDFVAQHMTLEQLDRMRNNPRLRPMDVSKGVRDLAVGAAKDTSQPRTMAPVVSSMQTSAATAKDAVRGTYDATMGMPPDAWEELDRLQRKAQSIGQSKIAPPLIMARPVDTSSTIAEIDKVLSPTGVKMSPGTTITPTPLQQRLTELRQQLASGDQEVLTSADRLHSLQSDLRREAEDLSTSATGSDKRMGRQLMNFRNMLVNNIDASAPGYKAGLVAYKDQKDIERAFQLGQNLFINSKDPKSAPGYLKQWINDKNRSPEEIAAARTGARQAVEQKMSSIKSSALDPGNSGTNIPQIDFNRQKLEILFSKENTDKMFQHLQDERDIATTNMRGLANSTTAEAQAAQQSMKPREISAPHSQLPTWALVVGAGAGALTNPSVGAMVGGSLLGSRAVKAGYDWIGRQADLSRNVQIGNIISRNDPQTISQLAQAIIRVQRRNKLNNLLAPP